MFLTDISLKRPVFATVLILSLIVMGLFSYTTLTVDEWPNVEFPYVTVEVMYAGAAPDQIESKVITKIEEAVGSVAGVKHIFSTAVEGYAVTAIEFNLEVSPQQAAQDVRDKVAAMRNELPTEIEEPVITKIDPQALPIVSVAVSGQMSVRELSTLVEDEIKPRLESINGVGSVEIKGALDREVQINLSNDKINAYGLTVGEVVNALKSQNIEVPAGKVTDGQRQVTMRTMGNYKSAEEFLNTPIARRDGQQLYLHNIATVTDGTAEADSIARLNGQAAIAIDVVKQSGSNTIKVAEEVKQVLEDTKELLPAGTELTLVRDTSIQIKHSIDEVLSHLIIGGLLAVAIVFIFLGDWRSTLISAIAIPASVIATFVAMKFLGFTLNNMSLMALSLAVGLLIDDAIVVIENIVRHMEMGKDKYTAALEGTKEIGLAVTATTLTLVAVFVPVGMMSGIVGQFFKQFGITVAFAVLISLFVAFTLTPMMSSRYLKAGAHGANKDNGKRPNLFMAMLNKFNKWFDTISDKTANILSLALEHRLKVVAVAALMFIGSLMLIPLLGTSFVVPSDTGELNINVAVDAGMSVEKVDTIAAQMEGIIKEVPEVIDVYAVSNMDEISIYVKLLDKNERDRADVDIASELRGKLNLIPATETSIMTSGGMGGASKPVRIIVRGTDMEILALIADHVENVVNNVEGAVDVTSSYKPGKPDVQLTIKPEQAADLGISTAVIADTVRSLFNGADAGQFTDGEDRFDVVVRLDPYDRTEVADLNNVYLASSLKNSQNNTTMVPLSQVTNMIYGTTPGEIKRYDRMKEISIEANLENISLGEFNAQVMTELNKWDMPEGYFIDTAGESEQMAETFSSMIMAISLGVIFVFFVLAAQFESFIDPFAIMLSLPLAVIGAILGLLVMGSDLSLMSLIGVIMLMGLVTKNAILLIDFTKQRREEGIGREAALIESAKVRFRPIMMTTLATIFGMLPLALAMGPGAEGRAPMAYAIIGGLVTSTFLTMVVVPVVYSLIDEMKEKWQQKA